MRQRALILPLLVLVFAVGGAVWWLLQETESAGGRGLVPAGSTEAVQGAETAEVPGASLADPGDRPEPGRSTLAAAVEAGAEAELGSGVVARPASGRLRGSVVDRLGNPVPGASVSVRSDGFSFGERSLGGILGLRQPESVEADASGRFELVPRGRGELVVEASAAGYAPGWRDGVVLTGDEDLTLEPIALARGALLAGRVMDASGRSVEGAELMLMDADGGGLFAGRERLLTTSAFDGSFEVDRLACGPWRIDVRHADHPPRVFEGRADHPGERIAGLEFQLEEGSAIRGRVVGLPTDAVLGDMHVRARPEASDGIFGSRRDRRSSELVQDGSFELTGCKLGQAYSVKLVRKTRGLDDALGGGSSLSEPIVAEAGLGPVTLTYQPEASLSFQVVDQETGAPIEMFDVKAGLRFARPQTDESGRPLRQHPEGRVRIGDLRPPADGETLTLEISAVGYRDYFNENIEIEAAQTLNLGVLSLEPVPVLVVRVIDPEGEPVEGASATLTEVPQALSGNPNERRVNFNMEFSAGDVGEVIGLNDTDSRRGVTDAEGVVTLSSLGGDQARLRVEADGYAPAQEDFLADSDERMERTVQLARGGSITVAVVDPEGQPVRGVEVRHQPPGADRGMLSFGPGSKQQRTNSQGELRFENLAPGTHAFQLAEDDAMGSFSAGGGAIVLTDSAGGGEWTEVVLEGEGEARLTLTTDAKGSLIGRVREAGLPLVGARLKLKEIKAATPGMPDLSSLFGGGGPEARTDGEGRYAFEDVTEGEYELVVEHPNRRMAETFELRVRPEEQEFDVELAIAVVEGTLVDEQGMPIAGAQVWAERVTSEPAVRALQIMVMDDGSGESVSVNEGGIVDRVTTEADGRYVLRGVAADVDLEIHAESDDIQPTTSDVFQVAPDQTRTGVDLVGTPAGAIKVSAVLANGSPARMVLVTARYADPDAGIDPETKVIGPSGAATIKGLRPGLWMLSARSVMGGGDGPAGDSTPLEVEVVAKETVDATVVL